MTPTIGPDAMMFAVEAAVALVIGFTVGLLHYRLLWWTTRRLLVGGLVIGTIVVQVLRLALIAGAMALIAWYGGAVPLIAAAVGLTAARQLVLRHVGAQP